ncbi:MAG: hypothetical protein AABW64_04760 [Nanoarchaeota archaeon]
MVDENVKNAFTKVKEDIDLLKQELNKNKKDFFEQKKILEDVNSKLDLILKDNDKKEVKNDFFNVSIGNKGVVDDRQLSMVNSRRLSTMIDDDQRSTTTHEDLATLNQTLILRFKTLTDREFSIFLAIYELERQLGGEVTYIDLANKLNLTESSVKTHVNRILSKRIPISKERFFNRKSSLSIKKGFKDPTIVAELIKMRHNPNTQTTLLDL